MGKISRVKPQLVVKYLKSAAFHFCPMRKDSGTIRCVGDAREPARFDGAGTPRNLSRATRCHRAINHRNVGRPHSYDRARVLTHSARRRHSRHRRHLTPCRDLLSHFVRKKAVEANPNCAVVVNIVEADVDPYLAIEYSESQPSPLRWGRTHYHK